MYSNIQEMLTDPLVLEICITIPPINNVSFRKTKTKILLQVLD